MIAVRCFGEHSFGGRTQDDFIIYDFDDIEDFKKSINKSEFTQCKEVKYSRKLHMVVEEELVDRIVNFSNYMKIKALDIDYVNKSEYEEIISGLCKHCARHDGTISEMLSCRYYPTTQQKCKNYKETLTAKYRRKFKGVNINEIKNN